MALVVYGLTFSQGRIRWITLAVVTLLFAATLSVPGTARNKFMEAVRDMDTYRSQLSASESLPIDLTSTGARLMMWTLSVQEISKRPLLGGGTGSYHDLAKNRLQDDRACSVACVHPHNQILFFGVEYGLVGVLMFGFYFVRAAQHALRLAPLLKATTLGFLAIFFADSLVHGSMWLSGEQHLFTYVLALWMSYPPSDESPSQSSSTRRAG